MILVDSSIWMDHIARPVPGMRFLLQRRLVLMHPFVAGEVLMGSLADRSAVRAAMAALQQALVLQDVTVQANIERWAAYNRGVGYIDVHLLSSADASEAMLWTRDRRLGELAAELRLRFAEP